MGSGVDSLVQKTGHQQQQPGNRRWDVIEVLGFLCVVLAYGSRHVGIRGYLDSDRLTAPPIKRLSWLLFQEQGPSAASHLPALLTTHHPLQPAAFLAASTTELFLLAGTTSHRRCKMLWKGKSLPFRLTVWGGKKKITLEPKDRLELYHSKFCCFEDQQLWHCLELCYKSCVLGSTQTSWIRVCMFTVTSSDS